MSRVLTGLPSQLGQTLINDICDKPVKLQGCCCAKAVYTLWSIQCPLQVRSQCANLDFNADTYHSVFEHADKVFMQTRTSEVSAGVAAISTGGKAAAAEPVQVAATTAVRGGRAQRNRGGGNRGGGRGSANTQSNSGTRSTERGPRHHSNPPTSCCDNHFRWGADCWFCLEPLSCPWASKIVAKPGKKNKNQG